MTHSRVAVVTGAAGGIGRALTTALVSRGLRVLAVDRDTNGLNSLASEMTALGSGGECRCLVVDQASNDASNQIVQAALDYFGSLHILINNAGIGPSSITSKTPSTSLKSWEVSPDDWNRFVAINATAPFLLTRLAVPHMLKNGWGRVITVTTSLGSMTRAGFVPYGPTKAAAESFMSILAYELEGSGITSNVLVPGGYTNTPMIPDGLGLNRDLMLQPEVMVDPLVFLVSEQAGTYNGYRVVAANWPTGKSDVAAMERACAPVAWRGIATPARRPGR